MRIVTHVLKRLLLCGAVTVWSVAFYGSILRAADRCGWVGESSGVDTHACLGCHDGVLAGDVTGSRAEPGAELHAGSTTLRLSSPVDHAASHPVGIDYDAAFARSGGKIRSSSSLPSTVHLENGRLGCLSCHDASSSLPSKLSLPREGSMLCYACHDI